MNARVFIDSNLWLYALLEGQDEQKAMRFRRHLSLLKRPVISAQVVSECAANLIKKVRCDSASLQRHCLDLMEGCEVVPLDAAVLQRACVVFQPGTWSWWDSVIIAAALESGCSELWSEDLQAGRVIEGRLSIVNPLA